jgi:hypothetical protein
VFYSGPPVFAVVFGVVFFWIINRSHRAATREPEELEWLIKTMLTLDLLVTVPWLCAYMLAFLPSHGLGELRSIPFLMLASLLVSLPNLVVTGMCLFVFTHANDVRVVGKVEALSFLIAGLILPTIVDLTLMNSMTFE